jgi:hypothetical protein
MSNGIARITTLQYATILDNAKKSRAFIAEINGKNIKNMDDYLSAVWKAFRFPQTGHVNYYAYLDWIRDLDWLAADSFIFTIRNIDSFMTQSPKEKELVIGSIENTVIPWWESKIEQFQVGGKAKPFNVYFIK